MSWIRKRTHICGCCIGIKGEVSQIDFTDRSEVVPLCRSSLFAVSLCLVLSVSSSSWCLGRAAVCDCGTPWTFLLPFLYPATQ